MAQQGRIPKKLADAEQPFCIVCTYGKATRKPWKDKTGNKDTKTVSHPGVCVSVNSVEPATASFVVQLKVTLM